MSYSLTITEQAARAVAGMSEEAHDLLVLAMLDLPKDPHGLGTMISVDGPRTKRTFVLGGFGMLLYVVNDDAATVEIADVVWIS